VRFELLCIPSYDCLIASRDRADRDHWNRRYSEQTWPDAPSAWLVAGAELLPDAGRALDVAGGTGRNAIWLAQRGWDVTIADISDVALVFALERAESLHVQLETSLTDLGNEPLPEGPWDLVMLFQYLDRDLLMAVVGALRPGGVLIGALATVTNLERNDRPPLPYLLEDGELPGLMGDLELVRYEEGWQDDRHDARFVARNATG
jgi:SAM-dependent methyltransferase